MLPAGAFFPAVVDKKGKLHLSPEGQVPVCRLVKVRRTDVFSAQGGRKQQGL